MYNQKNEFENEGKMKKRVFLIGLIYAVIGLGLLLTHFVIGNKKGNLDIKIKCAPSIMPMAYKVYGNPEIESGKYYLAKIIMENTGEGSIKNLSISYRVPSYITWTTPSIYKEVLPGQTVIDLFYPQFPQKILNVLNETTSTVEIKIKYNNGKEDVEEVKRCNFQIRGRNEFVYTDIPEDEINDVRDMYTNVELLACFVTPEDPVIKYLTQQIQKNILQGTVAGVTQDQKEIIRFMKAIYEFEKAIGLVYGGTLGLPEKINGQLTMVQHIRLPREVITGGAGLCVELSTLFCSIAQSAGLNCGIFVTSRHAFPAIIAGGNIIPIEATGIGGEGIGGRADFEKALKTGMKEAQMFFQGGSPEIGVAIDFLNINSLHAKGLRPPDLQDDETLKKKIDDMFKKLANRGQRNYNNNYGRKTNYQRQTQTYTNPGGFRKFVDSSGTFSFSYPSNWQIQYSPNPYVPSLLLMAVAPDMSKDLEVYFFPGFSSPDQALSNLYSTFASMGTNIQYQPAGAVNIGGKRYSRYAGMSSSQYGIMYWSAYFTNTTGGVLGFVIGSTSNRLDTPDLVTIKNSFRVMR